MDVNIIISLCYLVLHDSNMEKGERNIYGHHQEGHTIIRYDTIQYNIVYFHHRTK